MRVRIRLNHDFVVVGDNGSQCLTYDGWYNKYGTKLAYSYIHITQ
jgi:hypothetical protein